MSSCSQLVAKEEYYESITHRQIEESQSNPLLNTHCIPSFLVAIHSIYIVLGWEHNVILNFKIVGQRTTEQKGRNVTVAHNQRLSVQGVRFGFHVHSVCCQLPFWNLSDGEMRQINVQCVIPIRPTGSPEISTECEIMVSP